MTRRARRHAAAILPASFAIVLGVFGALLPAGGSAAAPEPAPSPPWTNGATVVEMPDGGTAYVQDNGQAVIVSADGASVTYRRIDNARFGDLPLGAALPSKEELAHELSQPPARAYLPDEVLVAFADGAALPASTTARTGDAATDAVLSRVGATGATAVLRGAAAAEWRTALSAAEAATGTDLLDPARTFRVNLAGTDPRDAAVALLGLPNVAYASPAWTVSAGSGQPTVPASVVQSAPTTTAADGSDDDLLRLPKNDAIKFNAQSHWNTPALDAATAFDRITRELGELPGTGEIIATVGIGAVTSNPTGPCGADVEFYGPTTVVIDGQRYLDLPSMPLIPTFTADQTGAVDPVGEACPRLEPQLHEVGAVMSVLAPLPHGQQRPEAVGSGLTDLLGLAPGAEHRLVVPTATETTIVDLAGALLGASQQEPAPTVITVSAHFGGDPFGFPNRSLEDDALVRSIITTIVNGQGITVAGAANDGLTTERATAYGPSGGAVATDVAAHGERPTTLRDVRLSTAPSEIPDSGSIMVGATTLNDISAIPPLGSDDPQARAQQAYPTVRWTGSTTYASGFGERVDLSAPGDSILAFAHPRGGGPRDVAIQLANGTGVAAAEVAAAAAIVRQVSRAVGDPIEEPAEVRAFLAETGRAVPDVPQLLEQINVGPQLDLGAAVAELFDRAGRAVEPGVLRVAVSQRRPIFAIHAIFETWTDPKHIDLLGPVSPIDGTMTGSNARAWITIAPDWVGLPDGTKYILKAAGRDGGFLAATPSARLLPEQILAAADLPLADDEERNVSLEYLATYDGDVLATATVTLGLGPSDGLSQQVHAPDVAPVVTGDTVRISYDLTDAKPVIEPELVVSFPGRAMPDFFTWVPALRIPLDDLVGTVDVPVSDLEGGGIYGVGVNFADLEVKGFPYPLYSDFGFFRVAPTASDRPPAPLLARSTVSDAAPDKHFVRLRATDSVKVRWDASGVPGASGARLEVSAAGPTIQELISTFNNPDGTERDANGNDTGSVAWLDLPTPVGTATFSPAELGLYSTMSHGLRVLAVDAQGHVVGSAGAVSTVALDGVNPRRGSIELGYGIDPGSGRGLLTTRDFNDDLVEVGGAQAFDVDTLQVTRQPLPPTPGVTYQTLGSGVYAGPTGLVRELEFGVPTGAWSVPRLRRDAKPWTGGLPDSYVPELGGSDLPAKRGALLMRDREDADGLPFWLAMADVAAGTSGRVHDVSEALAGQPDTTAPVVMGYDAAARVACIAFAYDFFAPPLIELVDVKTGDARLLDHPAVLSPLGLDVVGTARGEGQVIFTSFDGSLSSIDFATGDVTSVAVPNGYGHYVAADEQHGLVLVAQPNADPYGFDKNDLSVVRVYDADLQLITTIQRFNLYNTPLYAATPQLQVDPATRTGWFVGPLQEQLAVFPY